MSSKATVSTTAEIADASVWQNATTREFADLLQESFPHVADHFFKLDKLIVLAHSMSNAQFYPGSTLLTGVEFATPLSAEEVGSFLDYLAAKNTRPEHITTKWFHNRFTEKHAERVYRVSMRSAQLKLGKDALEDFKRSVKLQKKQLTNYMQGGFDAVMSAVGETATKGDLDAAMSAVATKADLRDIIREALEKYEVPGSPLVKGGGSRGSSKGKGKGKENSGSSCPNWRARS